jgi:hypothetical protein
MRTECNISFSIDTAIMPNVKQPQCEIPLRLPFGLKAHIPPKHEKRIVFKVVVDADGNTLEGDPDPDNVAQSDNFP